MARDKGNTTIKKRNKKEKSGNVNYAFASVVLRRLTFMHASFFFPVRVLISFLELILFVIVPRD